MDRPVVRCHTHASGRLGELVRNELEERCRGLRPRRIVVKPNWVLHETESDFPIRALVTDSRLIEAVVEACLDCFPGAESILVGDCPLQWADWPLLCRQSGLTDLMEPLRKRSGGRVWFRDLRREVVAKDEHGFMAPATCEHGDPEGYREVALGTASHLEPLSGQTDRFAVNDYSTSVTRSNHRPGQHAYLVSQSILNADLFINLPKWKSHQKSGVTGALKNLVGVNGDKAYLPHFRKGAPYWGGDEYPDRDRWLYWCQTTLRQLTQKRSPWLYRTLQPGWRFLKRCRGMETRWTDRNRQPKRFYVAGGAWHGNDTLWRMIYDLNLVIQCADAKGRIHKDRQRHYVCLVDGLIAGEGNGPLQPLPRDLDWLISGKDPFAVDAALTHFMGFEIDRVPLVARRGEYLGPEWGRFQTTELEVEVDGARQRLLDSGVNFAFAPPPGWREHVER